MINCDENYARYVGWSESNPNIQYLFSRKNINYISHKVSEILEGVDVQGRKIVIPDDKICHVISSVLNANRPRTGDIYSRYVIPGSGASNVIQDVIDRVIEIITSTIRNELEMIECNNKLTAWTTVLGDFNEHGLRSHPPIKVSLKRPSRGIYNMMY